MSDIIIDLILDTEPFKPEGGGISSFGVGYLALTYVEIAKIPSEDLSCSLSEMIDYGYISHADKGSYSATVKGRIARMLSLAKKGKLQLPLIEQKKHEADELILAIFASHTIGLLEPSSFTIQGMGVYLFEYSIDDVNDVIQSLLKKCHIRNNAPFDNGRFSITGAGIQHYHSVISKKLNLPSDAGILSRVEPPLYNNDLLKLPIEDERFKENLNERWAEMEVCAVSEAWLASVTMLGSVLEGVLIAVLENNSGQALNSAACPVNRRTEKKPINTWTLAECINVAVELKLIPASIEKHIHELRDTRNFVHPQKQIRDNIVVDQALYRISREVTQTVIDALINS